MRRMKGKLTRARVVNAIKFRAHTLGFRLNAIRKYFDYRDSPDYRLRFVDMGVADRSSEDSDDTAILERICTAYIKAKAAQAIAAPAYRPSNEWLPIYEKPLQEVMQALAQRAIPTLNRIYRNFWRDPCSTGLLGFPIDMKKNFFSEQIGITAKLMYLNDTQHRFRLWRHLSGGKHPISVLDAPMIGNPYGYYADGRFIKGGSDYFHHYATRIGELLNSERAKCALELGGGFGGMAYYFIRDNPGTTYIDLDLPENMALTAYYLLKSFPEKRALLFGEADLSEISVSSYDFMILPSLSISELKSSSIGLAFNSYSLAEMSRETITEFVSHFDRLLANKGYLFHVNHTKNSLVVGDDFGVDETRYQLVYKTPALWNAALNARMDEGEYLYKKLA